MVICNTNRSIKNTEFYKGDIADFCRCEFGSRVPANDFNFDCRSGLIMDFIELVDQYNILLTRVN